MKRKYSFEIERSDGSTMMAFEITIKKDGELIVTKTQDCSWADVDADYIFDTENDLVRIQAND